MPRWLKFSLGLGALGAVLAWFVFLDREDAGRPRSVRASGPEPTAATTIGLVLPAESVAEQLVWEEVARQQEGSSRVVLSIYRVNPDEPPSRQADLIRQAAAEGCEALIVLPREAADVADAVAEVRREGTPVVLLDVPVPSEGLPPIPTVRFEDERVSAKKLVDAAVAAAREAGTDPSQVGKLLDQPGFPADGPALILRQDRPDHHSVARVAALREALAAAGVRVLPDATFTGFVDAAKLALRASHELYPDVAMVFADDDMSIKGASEYRHLLNHEKRRYVLAGYAVDPMIKDLATYNVTAGMVDRNIKEPMRAAFRAALALARGESVSVDIRTPTPFHGSTGREVEGAFPSILLQPTSPGLKMPAAAGNPRREDGPDH